jgi:D-alanyl-D-alanine carboxypeptidase
MEWTNSMMAVKTAVAARLGRTSTAARIFTASSLGLTLALGGFAPLRTEATTPMAVPWCGTAHTSTGVIPAYLPVRPAESTPPPAVSAKAVAVIDGETGRLLYDVGGHERRSPASTTKIMTAILALENADENMETVSQVDGSRMIGSSVMGLRPGVSITMRDLLYGLMLPSGNDAAVEIARNIDGDNAAFVQRMNDKAAAIGLDNTHFVNPHGLDNPDHYSTAYDLAMLGRYSMGNEEFRRIVGTTDYQLAPPSSYGLHNGNSLLAKYPGADGIKIGWTDAAGWTLVGSAERDGHRVFVTVLDSQDRDADAAALLDWAFTTYRWDSLSPKTAATLKMMQRLDTGKGIVRSIANCG